MKLAEVYQRWANRLTETAEYLDGPVRAAIARKAVYFNILNWASKKPRPELTCGTVACVGGFATNIFNKSGLILIVGTNPFNGYDTNWLLYDKNFKTERLDACETFFGTKDPFSPQHYEEKYNLIGAEVTLDVAIQELTNYAIDMRNKARLFRG